MTQQPAANRRRRTYLLVGIAGAVGTSVRHGIEVSPVTSPTATLVANVLGCLLLGALVATIGPENRRIRAVVGGGFLGSLTTYSALATTTLDSELAVGIGYLATTYILGFTAIWLGSELTRRWSS